MREFQRRMVMYALGVMVFSTSVLSLTSCYQKEIQQKEERTTSSEEVASTAEVASSSQELLVGEDFDSSRYPNANDYMVYIPTEDGIEQWSLAGEYQQTFSLDEEFSTEDLLWVDNEEIIWCKYQDSEPYTAVMMRTPISRNLVQIDYAEEVLIEKSEKIFAFEGDESVSGGAGSPTELLGSVYVNEDYIISISDYSNLYVYDRKAKKQLKWTQKSKENYEFSQYRTSAADMVCGDKILLHTGKKMENAKKTKYGFAIYQFGDKKTDIIDDRCFGSAAYIADSARDKVYYQIIDDQSIWQYDSQTGKRSVLISEKEFKKCYKQNQLLWDEAYYNDSLFVDGDTLYFVKNQDNPVIFSYSLTGKELIYEKELTEEVSYTDYKEQVHGWKKIAIHQGKLLLSWYNDNEVENYFYYMDMNTGEIKYLKEKDSEKIFFALFGGWEEPGTPEKKVNDSAVIVSPSHAPDLSAKRQILAMTKFLDRCDGGTLNEYRHWAVTDLDQNGKLELLISSDMQGSGRFTYSKYYQISEDGQTLRLCSDETVYSEGDFSQNEDIVNNIKTAYYDPQKDIYYYLASDYASAGVGYRGCWYGAMALKDGMLRRKTYASRETTWNAKKRIEKWHYYKIIDGKNIEISEADFDAEKLADQYFEGFEKKSVNVCWVEFKGKKKNLTKKKIKEKLMESYEEFMLE